MSRIISGVFSLLLACPPLAAQTSADSAVLARPIFAADASVTSLRATTRIDSTSRRASHAVTVGVAVGAALGLASAYAFGPSLDSDCLTSPGGNCRTEARSTSQQWAEATIGAVAGAVAGALVGSVFARRPSEMVVRDSAASREHHTMRTGAVAGLVAGAIAGAVVGSKISIGCKVSGGACDTTRERLKLALGGGVTFGAVGTLIGGYVGFVSGHWGEFTSASRGE